MTPPPDFKSERFSDFPEGKIDPPMANKSGGGVNSEGTEAPRQTSRRDFLGWIIKGGILATLAGMIFPALEYILPVVRRGPGSGAKDVGMLEDIPVWGSKKIILAGSALILIRTPQEVKAFSAICTHLGCIVDWDGKKKEILCPCHAGVFDPDGRVVSGPPPRPLPSHVVKVVDGRMFVAL